MSDKANSLPLQKTDVPSAAQREDDIARLSAELAAQKAANQKLQAAMEELRAAYTESVRSHTEETLRQNEALFSTIIEQAPGGVYVIDEGFRMMQIIGLARPTFAAAEPVMGRDLGEVMRILWGPEVGPQLTAIFRHTLETGERYVSPRFTEVRPDLGEEKSYEWETQRLTLPSGRHGVVCYFADTTERERAAAALRESENFNRSIVENSEDCLKVLDLSGALLSMSPRGRQMLGIADLQPYLGKSWVDLWEGAYRDAARAAVAAAAAGTRGTMAGLFRTPGGESKWFDITISPIPDASGAPVRLLAVSRDITERRRAGIDARFLAEVSQDLVELSEVGEIMQTVGARLGGHLGLSLVNFVHINAAEDEAVVSHAWHRPEVPSSLGRYRLEEYFTPEFQATLSAGEIFIVRDAAHDPRMDAVRLGALKIGAFICAPLVKDGRWCFTLNIHHSSPHDWQPGEIALTREVTARLWARLERVRMETALHESEERFRAAVGAVSSLLWTNDAQGMMTGDQPGWGGFTGQTLAEYQGYGWAQAVHPDDAPPTIAAWEKAVAEKMPFEFEHRVRRHDGAWRVCAIRAVPVLTEDGEIREWVGVHTDITERRELEAALVSRAEDLARADRSKDEFLAMLAHELRNPLAPLRNASEIMKERNVGEAERGEAQRIIDRSIENMARMLEDLLDVSRITEGKIQLRRESVALAAILHSVAGMVRPACAARRQEFTVTLPAEPIWLNADATRLEQIFTNLLGNACKYSGDGCRIALTAEVSDSSSSSSALSSSESEAAEGGRLSGRGRDLAPREVIVRVTDDGIGIDPELLPRIFDLFVQSSRTLDRAHGGLGIGLTLVQRLVKLHGGGIEARSAGLGRGAEFIVRLPVLPAAPAAPVAPATVLAETPHRILIVDDNEDSARSLAMLQKRRGHTTRTAATGPEALVAAAEFLPDVVLLDIGLPGMDGFEVARKIRAMPALRGVFIIAMSGYGRDEDRAEAKLAGFDEYLVKPVDLEQLRAWLRQHPKK